MGKKEAEDHPKNTAYTEYQNPGLIRKAFPAGESGTGYPVHHFRRREQDL
jgi:hypothetical protein